MVEGGVQILRRDTIYAAILETPDYYARLVSPWKDVGRGLKLDAVLPMVLNDSYKLRSQSHQLMTDAQRWCELDYTRHLNPRTSAKLRFRATRRGTGHGITAWFEAQLVEGVGFSTAPGTVGTIYGQGFLPWLEPVEVETDQEIEVDLRADPVGDDHVWRWDTKIAAHKGHPERVFRQSTFLGAQFTPEGLRRRAVDFVPKLSESGQAERWLIEAMDGGTTLQEIANTATQRFPKVFLRQDDAFRRVSALAEKFSR